MDFRTSRIQPRKKIKIGDDSKHDVVEAACDGDFWKEAPEDILLEIFIRLPDSRSAVRTASVCQYWHSVISKNPHFIPRFNSHHHQHQHRYPLPYAIFFRKADDKPEFAGPQHFQPICKLFSDEPVLASTNFLDFLPCPMVIRGSCNDLLLVSPGSRNSRYLYICNPFTKQYIELPKVPRPNLPGYNYDILGHALVCMPGPTKKFRFKVVEIKDTRYPDPVPELPHNTSQAIMMFCSELGKWKIRRFHYPQPTVKYPINWLHGVACNGTLFWLEFAHFGVNRVVYLDLSNDQCGAVDFPGDSCRDRCFPRAQIGVVRVRGVDELRLLQVVLTTHKKSTVVLKVWKLSQNDHTNEREWVLVHQIKKLKKPNPKSFQALPFVHPSNGDVVFLVWGQKVFEYNLKETTPTYELAGKLQEPLAVLYARSVAPRDQLLQFPLMHTYQPTEICLT